MIVKKLESPVYHRRQRRPLPGRGVEGLSNGADKSFDQYLLEAFQGEVVQNGDRFSGKVSSLQQENLIRLSQL